MRKSVLFLLLAPCAGASVALAAPVARPVKAPTAPAQAASAPSQPSSEAQLESLRQRLLASQQTIATLERELAEEKNRTIALERCRVKNGRLVGIGRQLVEGYQKRWRITHKDPFQFGRRRFEFEMQALTEAVYDEGADVTAKVALPTADAPADAVSTPAPATAQPSGN